MDEFSDDGFDDLNDTALQQLENNAIQFTQAQKLAQSQAPQTQHNAVEYGFDDDDFDDTVVIDEQAQPPPKPPIENLKHFPVQPSAHSSTLATSQRWNQHLQQSRPSYPSRPQYPTPRRLAPQPVPSQRYAPLPSARPHPPHQPQQSQFARPPLPGTRPYSVQPSQSLHPSGPAKQQNEVIAALQARLSELQSDLTAAKGEAAILRSKYDKAQATHDAEVARLKKQNAEQLSKQERILEAAKAAERTATTELQFARQDLREEIGRAKSRRKDGPATPKKNRTWGVADGFDGVEILSSPTKGQSLRRKDSAPSSLPPSERTPSKGKRKRPIVDSPTFALETHSGDGVPDDTLTLNAPPGISLGAVGSLPFDVCHSLFKGRPASLTTLLRFLHPLAVLEACPRSQSASWPAADLRCLFPVRLPFRPGQDVCCHNLSKTTSHGDSWGTLAPPCRLCRSHHRHVAPVLVGEIPRANLLFGRPGLVHPGAQCRRGRSPYHLIAGSGMRNNVPARGTSEIPQYRWELGRSSRCCGAAAVPRHRRHAVHRTSVPHRTRLPIAAF